MRNPALSRSRPCLPGRLGAGFVTPIAEGQGSARSHVIEGEPTDKRFKDILTDLSVRGCNAIVPSFEKQGRIERQTAAGWETEFDEFSLVEDCGAVATLPACVTLAPGAVLRPVPWNGYTCYGQCPRDCKKNVYRPPGTFRLVLTVCGGGAQVMGTPFFMGPRSKQ